MRPSRYVHLGLIALLLVACGTGGPAQTTGSLVNGGAAGQAEAGEPGVDAGNPPGDGTPAGGSANDSMTTIPGTTLPLPDSCAKLGFAISFGCENCPTEPPHCECLVIGASLLLPEQSCTWGKCLVAYDCERLCQNVGDMGALLGEDVTAASDCKNALALCTEDAECGRGRCRDVTATEPGRCFGADNEPCEADADCAAGLHCVRQPDGRCRPPGTSCNDQAHCEPGSVCVLYSTLTSSSGEEVEYGGCSTGEISEICTLPEHCVDPYQCILVPEEPPGECSQSP